MPYRCAVENGSTNAPAGGNPGSPGVYRSRAVTVSGWVDATVGLALVLAGSAMSVSGRADSGKLVLGLAVLAIGLLLGGAGLGRILARLEVHETKIVWTWAFAKHEHSLEDLTEAALVEPGSPSSGAGASGAAFLIPLGLGIIGLFALIGKGVSVFKAGPTLGTHTLIVIRRFGAPVAIRAIGTFAFRPEQSSAAVAAQAVQAAIASFHARFGLHRY